MSVCLSRVLLKKRVIEDEYFNRFNYELYGGTPILGVNSNVIIGHGISNSTAIMNMVKLAAEVVEQRLAENHVVDVLARAETLHY